VTSAPAADGEGERGSSDISKRGGDRYHTEKIVSLTGKYLTKVSTRVFISSGEAQQESSTHQ